MMRKKRADSGRASQLRSRAEDEVREDEAGNNNKELTPAGSQRLAHELRVHQIELEMQNEELRQAQVELEASRARYFDLYDMAPVGYVTIGGKGLILEANLTCATMLGVARDAMVGKPLTGSILPEDQDIFYLLLKQVLEKGVPAVREMRMKRRDGSLLFVRFEAVRAMDADCAPVCRAMLSDITSSMELEVLKGQFLGLVSHEMKTPLTVILGGLKTVLTDGAGLSEEVKRSLMNDAYLEAESLNDLVQNLLELNRALAGRIVLHSQPVDMRSVLKAVKTKAEGQYPRHKFVTRCPSKVPMVMGDRTRLERVILNLLDNAAKYSPEGSTVLSTCSVVGKELVVSVQDSGRGISSRDQERLFVPFERLGKDGPEFAGGTGLGLVVCKRLMEAHGGRIWVESIPGKGATFFIALPLAGSRVGDCQPSVHSGGGG